MLGKKKLYNGIMVYYFILFYIILVFVQHYMCFFPIFPTGQAFNDFRRKRPWISPNLLQPKGIALELPLGAKKTPGDAGAMNLLLENTNWTLYLYIYILENS